MSMPNIFVPGQIVSNAVKEYLDSLQGKQTRPIPQQIEADLLALICNDISDINTLRPKGSKVRLPTALPPAAIAQVVKALWPVAKIPCAGAETDPDYDIIGLYQDSGPDAGVYVTHDSVFKRLLREFNFTASTNDFREFMDVLTQIVERRLPCRDRELIAVNNGIFDYKNKKLLPFSPDYVFLSKSRVDYVLAPINPVIHNPDDGTDWDVESWMQELSDDPEIVNLLWEILGAIIRPNVSWNKAAFFYSETGNNGKGTLCALMRNLCGPGTYASPSLADFKKDFLLEPLVRASAIIVDENDVGDFVDKGANIKSVITNDVMQIDRKYKIPLALQFHGFMVQCLNEMPRFKDKSESFYRRLLFVPFSKCFTGKERRYIKDDYLCRPEVLQYVFWRVLNMDYYELSNPVACQLVMDSYRQYNDPVRQFAHEIFPLLTWDMVPLAYLFDLYVAWFKRNNPDGHLVGKQTFNASITRMAGEIPGWTCPGLDAVKRPGNDMSKPEPLTREYNLVNWSNPACTDTQSPHWTVPCLKQKYKGYFLRVTSSAPVVAAMPSTYGTKTA